MNVQHLIGLHLKGLKLIKFMHVLEDFQEITFDSQ